jgi:hypothetical protein
MTPLRPHSKGGVGAARPRAAGTGGGRALRAARVGAAGRGGDAAGQVATQPSEAAEAEARHARYYAALEEREATALCTTPQAQKTLGAEIDNLQAAWGAGGGASRV